VSTELNVTAKLKEIAPCQKELQVEVPSEAVDAAFEEVYQEIKKQARVPGFRPGFAPRDLLERHHGGRAREEVLNRLVHRSLEEALKPHAGLDLVGHPAVADVKLQAGKPLTYTAKLEIAPQVELGRYKGLKLTRTTDNGASEERVNEVLNHLRDTHAPLKPVLEPRAAAEGDYLLIDITEKRPGAEPQTQKGAAVQLDLQKDTHGVLKVLVGMNPGETRSVDVEGGISVKVDLKEIKTKDLPELTDAFAKGVGSYDSLEALKAAIRKDIELQVERVQRQGLEAQVVQQLTEGWKLDVPPSLVSSQAGRIVKQRSMDLMNRGIPQQEVEGQTQALTDQAKVDALKQVKLFFILRRIAVGENFQVKEEEIAKRVEEIAQNLQISTEEVRRDLEKRQLMEELIWEIMRRKVIDLIIREAAISEKKAAPSAKQ